MTKHSKHLLLSRMLGDSLPSTIVPEKMIVVHCVRVCALTCRSGMPAGSNLCFKLICVRLCQCQHIRLFRPLNCGWQCRLLQNDIAEIVAIDPDHRATANPQLIAKSLTACRTWVARWPSQLVCGTLIEGDFQQRLNKRRGMRKTSMPPLKLSTH